MKQPLSSSPQRSPRRPLLARLAVAVACLLGFTVLWTQAARAAVLLDEDFNYPDGTLTSASSGKWVTHSGTAGQVQVAGGSVTITESASEDVNTPLAGGPYANGTDINLYTAAVLKVITLPTPTNTYFLHFKDSATGFRGRVFITTADASPGSYRLGVGIGSALTSPLAQDLTPDVSYTVVTRHNLKTGAMTLWVDPTSESSPSAQSVDTATAAVTAVALRESLSGTANGMGTIVIDSLRVATSLQEVLPGTVLKPSIVTGPQSQSVNAGTKVTLGFTASGTEPLSYQWQKNKQDIPGAISPTLEFASITTSQAGKYRVIVSNTAGSATSDEADVLVTVVAVAPTITLNPLTQTAIVGSNVTFTAAATGTEPISYQWTKNNVDIPQATSTNLTLTKVAETDSGAYRLRASNQAGSATSDPATLTVQQPPPPPLTDIAKLHTLLDSTTWTPTDTTTLFTCEGIVTTYTNITSGTVNALFYMQDATAGVAVFWAGGQSKFLPKAGDKLRVTAPLTHFRGLLELSPNNSNAAHSVTLLSTNNPLPTPIPFDYSWLSDPTMIEPHEGSLIIVSDVYIDRATSTTFPSGATVNLTDGFGQDLGFPMFSNAGTEVVGQVKPSGLVSIVGVLGQFDTSSPYTSGYQVIPTRFADVISVIKAPTVRFTNILENLVRPGDLLTNLYAEQVLRPSEKLTLTVTVTDPLGRDVSVTPGTDLPASAAWHFDSTSGKTVTGTLVITATSADAGRKFNITLDTANVSTTATATWSVYVPTAAEQQVVITEYLANPSSSTNAPFYNPLMRSEPAPTPSTDDEYVEVANLSNEDLNVRGWKLYDGNQVAPRLVVYDNYTLSASNSVIFYGGPLNGYTPGIDVPAIVTQESSAGIALNNDGDTIMLRNDQGNLLARVVYNASMVSTNGSMSRYPDSNGAFVPQYIVSTNLVTPGRQWNGKLFSETAVVPATPFPVSVASNADGSITIAWTAQAGRAYNVLASTSVTGPYTPVASGLTTGTYKTTITGVAARFFRVMTP